MKFFYDAPRPRALTARALVMGVKQRRAPGASGETAKPSESRRRAKDAESRSLRRIARLFLLVVMLTFSVAGFLYARGYARMAEIKAKEQRLTRDADHLTSETAADMQKGKVMLKNVHAASVKLMQAMMADGQLRELDRYWSAMETEERGVVWTGVRDEMLSDPSLASLLTGEGKRVTDTLVPEMYSEQFAEDPTRVWRLTTMLVDGLEHGEKDEPSSNPGAVGHEEARLLYRSAILSRFTATFLIDLLNRMAAEAGVGGGETAREAEDASQAF